MSFRANLQYLRAQRNMPQEQLAMLLGVSRQAISKWESEKAYPEMDKLLMICDLFGCTLDDLVLGDVSRPAASASAAGSSNVDSSAEAASPLAASSKTAGIIAPIAELAQDITGYDEHRRRFALLIAGGVAAIIAGAGIGNLFDSDNSILGVTPLNDFLTFLGICVGVIIGLAMLIPGGMSHTDFKRRHPYVEDFYAARCRPRHRVAEGRQITPASGPFAGAGKRVPRRAGRRWRARRARRCRSGTWWWPPGRCR